MKSLYSVYLFIQGQGRQILQSGLTKEEVDEIVLSRESGSNQSSRAVDLLMSHFGVKGSWFIGFEKDEDV